MSGWRDEDVILKNEHAECTLTHAKLLRYANIIVEMSFVDKQPNDSQYTWIGYIFTNRSQCNVFGVMLSSSAAYSEHFRDNTPVSYTVWCYPAYEEFFVDIPAKFTLMSVIPNLARDFDVHEETLVNDARISGNLAMLAAEPQFVTLRWRDSLAHIAPESTPARRFASVIRTFLLVMSETGHTPLHVRNYHDIYYQYDHTVHDCDNMKDFAKCPPGRSVHFFPNVFHCVNERCAVDKSHKMDTYYAVGVDVYEKSIEVRDIYKWDITAYVKQYGLADFVDTTATLYDHVDMPANTLLLLSHRTDGKCLYYTLHTDGVCRQHTNFNTLVKYGGCMQWSMSTDEIARAIGLGDDVTSNMLPSIAAPVVDNTPAASAAAADAPGHYPGGYVVDHAAYCSKPDISMVILHENHLFLSTTPTFFSYDVELAAKFAVAVECDWFRQLPKDIIEHMRRYCEVLVPRRVMENMIMSGCDQCRFERFYTSERWGRSTLTSANMLSTLLYPSLMPVSFASRKRYAHGMVPDSDDDLSPLEDNCDSDDDLPPLEDNYESDSDLPPLEDESGTPVQWRQSTTRCDDEQLTSGNLPVDYLLSVQEVKKLSQKFADVDE